MAKKKALVGIILVAVISLSACYPIRVQPLPVVNGTDKGTVIIFRKNQFVGSAATSIFGIGESDYYQVSNGAYVTMDLPVGRHSLYVRSTESRRPYKTEISLDKGEVECLSISPNSSAIIGAAISGALLGATGAVKTKFFLLPATCLSDEELKGYSKEEYLTY